MKLAKAGHVGAHGGAFVTRPALGNGASTDLAPLAQRGLRRAVLLRGEGFEVCSGSVPPYRRAAEYAY
jgi:hypothetical protein